MLISKYKQRGLVIAFLSLCLAGKEFLLTGMKTSWSSEYYWFMGFMWLFISLLYWYDFVFGKEDK